MIRPANPPAPEIVLWNLAEIAPVLRLMSSEGDLLREYAERFRHLAYRARTDYARHKLLDWAHNFEVLADRKQQEKRWVVLVHREKAAAD